MDSTYVRTDEKSGRGVLSRICRVLLCSQADTPRYATLYEKTRGVVNRARGVAGFCLEVWFEGRRGDVGVRALCSFE